MKNLQNLYNFFNHPNLEIDKTFKGSDNLRMSLARDIVTIFLLRPTLDEISFDFDEVERISKVWEGSSEQFFFTGHRLWDTRENIKKSEQCIDFMEANDETLERYLHEYEWTQARGKKIFPKFKEIEFALACDDINQIFSKNNSNIEFLSSSDDDAEIDSLINYITWEPSFVESFCKEQRINKLPVKFVFKYRFDDERAADKLEAQIFNFIGPKNKARLLETSLRTALNENTTTKQKRSKI